MITNTWVSSSNQYNALTMVVMTKPDRDNRLPRSCTVVNGDTCGEKPWCKQTTKLVSKKHDHRAHVMIPCNGFVVKKRYPFALGFCELQSDSQLEQRVAAEQGADETTVVLQRLVYLSSRNFITVAGCKLLVATLQHRHCAQQDSLQLHTHVINDTILCHKSTGQL